MSFKQLLILLSCSAFKLHSTSIVYNLRVAQTTRRQTFHITNLKPSIAAATLFGQIHKLHDGTCQHLNGGLGTLIYLNGPAYMSAAFAAGHISTQNDQQEISRTQTDDILFTGGYSHTFGDRSRASISGLVGFPTHKDFVLEGFQLGTGHNGCGIQCDGSYTYSSEGAHTMMAAARYLHFFPRTISLKTPLLIEHFKFDPGTIMDLLVAHHSSWGTHALEVGYNPTFALGAHICPVIPDFDHEARNIRSNFYAAYQYGFLIKDHISAVIFGLSYGFDHLKTKIQNKYVISAWITWGINF